MEEKVVLKVQLDKNVDIQNIFQRNIPSDLQNLFRISLFFLLLHKFDFFFGFYKNPVKKNSKQKLFYLHAGDLALNFFSNFLLLNFNLKCYFFKSPL